MPTHRAESFEVHTSRAEELVDVTSRVREVVAAAGARSGIAVVYCPHTTAGITIQENADPDVQVDLLAALERMVPRSSPFRHAEGNSHAHVKSALVGASATVILENGAPVLGTWQGIYLAEFDGPRRRTVQVKLLAD